MIGHAGRQAARHALARLAHIWGIALLVVATALCLVALGPDHWEVTIKGVTYSVEKVPD